MNKKLLTAILSIPFMVSSVSPLMVKADDSILYTANKEAIFTSPECEELREEYAKQHIAENPNATLDKTGVVYPRVAVNIPGANKLDPQFRRKSGSNEPTSREYTINSDGGNRGWMTIRVYIPEAQVRHLESEACEETGIECPIPGDNDVVAVIKGKSVASTTEPGKFDVTYAYVKPGKNGAPDIDMKLKVFSDETTPSQKYFIVSSRKAKLPFPDSPVKIAETTDRYNEYYRQALSELPKDDIRRTYPGEVFRTACEEPAFIPFAGKVIIARNEDIMAAALKYQKEGGKTLTFVAASEVTVNGSPATQSAAEECIARNTGLFAHANRGSVDHYYVDPQKRPQGCLYNPLKCGLLRAVPVYCDRTAKLLPDITPENILSLPTMDFLLHASRNLNPVVGGACQPMLHPNPEKNKSYTEALKKWHATGDRSDPKIAEISELAKDEIYASAKQVICLARREGYSTVVFNNPGGGVFRNGINIWADALAQAIKAYGGNIQVVFTIFDKNIAPDCSQLLPFELESSAGKLNIDIYRSAMERHGIAYELR